MDVALLILRLTIGLLVAGHGAQKLFGLFGGYGLRGTSTFLGSVGYRPAVANFVCAPPSDTPGIAHG